MRYGTFPLGKNTSGRGESSRGLKNRAFGSKNMSKIYQKINVCIKKTLKFSILPYLAKLEEEGAGGGEGGGRGGGGGGGGRVIFDILEVCPGGLSPLLGPLPAFP